METLHTKDVWLHTNGGSAEPAETKSYDINTTDSLAKTFSYLDDARPPHVEPTRFSDSEIQQIADRLRHVKKAWSTVPRTYIVLRTIKQLHLLDELIDLDFTDHWIPVSPRQLPESLGSVARASFLEAQWIVLTKAMDLEKGGDGQHRHFAEGEQLPFQAISLLGSGGFGQVEKVISKQSGREYARKRIRRERLPQQTRTSMKSYITELEILKRLDHRHIVKLVGSYTDPLYLGLVMSPVADCNLADYFSADLTSLDKKRCLCTFFGCLTFALAYLHRAGVRHKDIKPQNILVKGDTVLLTDFGLSRISDETARSTTEGWTARTPRYCAPEVANYEPRNSSSDIWSLGCVFVEMVTVLKDETIQSMRTYFKSHGSRGQFFSNNSEASKGYFQMLSMIEPHCENKPLQWAQDMLQHDRHLRPSARALVERIISSGSSAKFCGSCCSGSLLDGEGSRR